MLHALKLTRERADEEQEKSTHEDEKRAPIPARASLVLECVLLSEEVGATIRMMLLVCAREGGMKGDNLEPGTCVGSSIVWLTGSCRSCKCRSTAFCVGAF